MRRGAHIAGGARLAAMAWLLGLALSGCATGAGPIQAQPPATVAPASVAPLASLAETQWRLLAFQSMDDAIGTRRTDDPSHYTMRLNGDGTVVLRLDCNDATGTWSAEASADPANGRFEFGPLTVTGAPCPPPSLDAQVAAQARYIRSYLLQDGRLYLSLMADAGIYIWERHVAEPTAANPGGARN